MDPSGLVVDTALDVGFIVYDIYEIAKDGSAANWIALSLDATGAIVPFITGLGEAYRIGKAGKTVTNELKFWKKSKACKGRKVYQRDDLIDLTLVDARGRTNLERMQKGLAPIGPDGKSIELHHMTQTDNGAIAEVTNSFHTTNRTTIHVNPPSIPSGINREEFASWKKQYWQERARDF